MAECVGHWALLYIAAEIINLNVPRKKKKLVLLIFERELEMPVAIHFKTVWDI